MPAWVEHHPLRVRFVFSDASTHTVRLDGLACSALVEQLAVGLANLAHPHGGLNAAKSVIEYRTRIGQLVRWLAHAGFAGTAADLIPAHLVGFWRTVSAECEATTRRLLRSVDRHAAPLRPDLREFLTGPALQPKRRSGFQPLRPYSDGEWQRLVGCCAKIIATSRAQHRAAVAAAGRGQDPAVAGWSPDNVAWLLHGHGPMTKQQAARHIGISASSVWKWGGITGPASQLFVTVDVAMAYRLLLGATSGIVPDGLDELRLGDVDWAGDATILLDYVKDRTGPESLNLPAPAVRVLRRWLEHSALLRGFAPEPIRARLWLAYHPIAGGAELVGAPEFDWATAAGWARRHELVGDDDQPLRIHKGRIRTTFHNRRDKSRWTGCTTIDPNHTPRVEGDHYLSHPTPVQRDALEAVIEDAQADLVRRASTPVVLGEDTVATAAAAALPERLAGLPITEQVIAELVGGQRDVFTAACVDQLAGLHGPAGRPCPARPWVCLLCPLAVFAPRHAPNLLRLKAFFARQFRQMPAAHFLAVFGPYARRLDDILPRFAPALLAAASTQVGDRDAELPLRPEEVSA